jgi:outer membrane protein assembly factor BamB
LNGKFVFGMLFALLLASMFTAAFRIHGRPIKALTAPSNPSSIHSDSGTLVPIVRTFTTVMESNTTAWDTYGIRSPFVLYDADTGLYKIWYTALSEATYWAPWWVFRWVIAYAESKDGVVWVNKTIVHDTGGPSFYAIASPWVLNENGTYRMWHSHYYDWVAGDWSSYIARMSSPDGISWPAFLSAGDVEVMSALGQSNPQGDGNSVGNPCVIYKPGAGYVMWYSVVDHYGPGSYGPSKIWRTTSSDGITWSNRQLSLPYVSGTWEGYITHPSVVQEDDGTYTMFYEAQYANFSTSIGIAKSLDGITWTNRTQFLKPSDLGASITSISEPFQFQDVNGGRYLYFAYYDGEAKFGRVQLVTVDWWPMFHHDLAHTGYSTSTAPNTNQILWTYTTGSTIVLSSPAVADGEVFIGSYDHRVYCLNAWTGAYIWSYETGSSVFSSPAVANGKVYVGSNDNKVYCLNASTGAHIWNYTTGAGVVSSPAVAGGVVYVGSRDYNVYALNASTGARIWTYATSYMVESSPAVADGKVYVGSGNGRVYALDAATGTLAWSYATGGAVASSPAVADGKVFIGSDNYNVYALNASSGAYIWNYATRGGVQWSSPAVAGGVVYVGSRDYNVYALNASTGARIWTYATGSEVESPAVADGKVYVSSCDCNVYALNASTGIYIWSYKTGLFIQSSPAVADGKVYVGSYDGKVYAFGRDHDVAVTNVAPSKTVIGQGYSDSINVTAANEGSYTETFSVTVYANSEIITSQKITLTSGNSATITFAWNTTGFAYGKYTISAYAWLVSGETNTADNIHVDGTVEVVEAANGSIGVPHYN